jgi:gluconate 2-dehydrogenase gamma chain
VTMVGMFSLPSYGGNIEKIGWRLIGFDDSHVWQPPFGYYDAEPVGKAD